MKIVLMGETSSFMQDALLNGLEEAKLQCEATPLNEKAIRMLEGEQAIIVLMMDEATAFDSSNLERVAELCRNEKKSLFVMGYSHQISAFSDILTDDVVTEVFKRPVNTRSVVERLADETKAARERARKKSILVVDDSGTTLHAIKDMLEPKYKVIVVNSGKQALSYLEIQTPDLILLDYEMPEMDGPATFKAIKSSYKTNRIPVFFLTAKHDADSVQNAISLNPQGYIIKSTPKKQILDRIETFFNTRK